jgi:hypothetical protein
VLGESERMHPPLRWSSLNSTIMIAENFEDHASRVIILPGNEKTCAEYA